MFSPSCIYGSIFESVVPKDNRVLAGRNRISHPIIIETKPFMETDANTLTVYLIFIGSSIASLPYLYTAIKKSGEAGILKQRVPFIITDVFSGEKSLLVNNETINTSFEPDVWEYDIDDNRMVRGDILVQILSPLRFKAEGHYSSRFSAGDFAFCLHRRTQTLCSQYGNNDFPGDTGYQFREKWAITENSLVWKDFTHYSAHQKGVMKLGGSCGFFVLSGEFSAYEQAMLRFAEIFHAGKNTNFGLGQISMWEKKC
jgi:hypothetical protein